MAIGLPTGTFNFDPSTGEVMLFAFRHCGIAPTGLTQEHMSNARMAVNLMLSDWSNKQVNLFNVDLVSVPLVQGQSVYAVADSTAMILDAYIRYNDGSVSAQRDRLIFPISRTEYASYPNKLLQSRPTVYWFDRLLNPTLTLWPVPDSAAGGTYNLQYYRVTQPMDAYAGGAATTGVTFQWLSAFAYGLASRLAAMYAPDKAAGLMALADQAWNTAATFGVENVPLFITPGLSNYFRV